MHVQVLVRTGRKHLSIYLVSSDSGIGFIQFMKKFVCSNLTHPPITRIGVHSGLKKTNSTYPRPPKKGRIPALVRGGVGGGRSKAVGAALLRASCVYEVLPIQGKFSPGGKVR
jgi:hypothetical protein